MRHVLAPALLGGQSSPCPRRAQCEWKVEEIHAHGEAKGRREALEEAAKVCDAWVKRVTSQVIFANHDTMVASSLAAAIRALAAREPQ